MAKKKARVAGKLSSAEVAELVSLGRQQFELARKHAELGERMKGVASLARRRCGIHPDADIDVNVDTGEITLKAGRSSA